jgi:hypothetical protein
VHELGHPESSIAPRRAFAALPHFHMRTSAHVIFLLILQRQIAPGYHPIKTAGWLIVLLAMNIRILSYTECRPY